MRVLVPEISAKAVAAVAIVTTATILLWVVLTLNWPLWVWLFLVLLGVAALLGCILLRKFWLRRRERSFADEVMEQEHPFQRTAAAERREGDERLREQWKRALTTLQNSQLKKQGNPLYVLPWFLTIGEPGSGKTSCLDSASVSSPVAGSVDPSGLPTDSCDWHFFPDAVILDTAGRYTVQPDMERDKEEWRTLLRLLEKDRRRQPINGVVVTVAADRLQSETVGSYGNMVRRRIDEMMRVLGVRFPVYLLVTKCDLVPGMTEFGEQLPEPSLCQPMGLLNRDVENNPLTFLETAFSTIQERVGELRLQLLVHPLRSPAKLVALPQELGKLKAGLDVFGEAAFGANNYQETPMLRGLFFCSAGPTPTEAANRHEEQRERRTGLFLHDLFAKMLPQDGELSSPTRRSLEWRSATANLALISWAILGVALCGLLTFSFLKNLSAIRQIPQEFSRTVELKGGAGDLATMTRYRDAIAAVEGINSRWWLPRLGLQESLKVERELKNRFCRRFREGFLASLDAGVERAIATNTATATDLGYGDYIIYLTRRINLLKGAQRGEGLQALMAMPQPRYAAATPAEATGDTAERFSTLFLSYLSWQGDSPGITREIGRLQSALSTLLSQRGGNLQWLAAWVEQRGSAPPVTLARFWGGSRQAANEVKVSAAFTLRGKKEMDSIVLEMESALPERHAAKAQRLELEDWYRTQSVASWRQFAATFPAGAARLNGEREWQQAAAKMATEQNPFFALLDTMALELAAQVAAPGSPDWLRQLSGFQKAKSQELVQSETVKKAASGGKKLLVSMEKKMGKEVSAQNIENGLAAAHAYGEYRTALAGVAPMTASRTQAYQAACQLYSEDPAVCKSPLNLAFVTARQLNTALAGNRPDAATAQLVAGPAEFLWSFLRRESSGHLQSQWEEQVLASTQGMTGQQATPILVGPDGLVWKFVKGPAAPFLTRTLKGYRPKQVLGGTVQFEGSFLSFLDGGAQIQAAAMTRQANYAVGIQGLPTDANREARIKPHATRLDLLCGSSTQSLANLNYPVGKTFNWSPDSCGDVTLQIEVGDLVLAKRYAGPQGFPEFLKSFAGGTRTFSTRDFPGERAALKKMGIRQIRVNYQITGSGPVVKQTNSVCGELPRNITRCTF